MVAPFETPTTRVPKAVGFNCPSCGASIELHAQGWAVSVVCGACGAQLDATDENLKVLQYGEKVTAKPRIPLGTRGTWKGAPWDVIGFQVVTISVEGTDYSWTEYVCFNPYRGFLYLSDYHGHWNVIEKLRRRPERESGGDRPTVALNGTTYKHFQTATAYTTAALGEFPWELRMGDHVVSRDFVAPPYILSAEASGNEVTWSLGTYTPPEVIQKAFGLAKPLMQPIGVFANQPNPFADLPKRMLERFALALIALVLLLILNVTMASNRTVLEQAFTYSRSQESQAAVTEVFDLEGRTSNVALELESDLDNDWLFLVLSLINETTGETREVTRQLSYYRGSDSDGSWTEGDKRERVSIASIPAGRYFLRVQAEGGEPAKPSASYTVRVLRDVPHYGFYGLGLLALLVPVVLSLFPSASFEGRRWAESDHAPTSSGDSDDDE
ncbi:DUF4178 domain-containing protein [Gemmatimonas sp.]|uniref:DUF4178 domain-containing protein n=1 Tax=Gemmatimonas sp. TaxID=1962908 RepID=UPI00286CDF65|nr:DUF4178 domain-containing protein [Gemmatimonas sp.]